MEAQCKSCGNFFDKHDILVTRDGLYCEGCVPADSVPASFVFHISWKGVNALTDYIDGERSLDILETMEVMRAAIDKKIISQIRGLIGGTIRESDSKSLDQGDAES